MSRSIVISQQGAKLIVKNQIFSIEKEGKEIKQIKPHDVESLILMGNVEITNSAITLILRRGIDCVFMTKDGRYKGRIVGRGSKNIILRIAQFKFLLNEENCIPIARAIVKGKIYNQRMVLMRVQRQIKDEQIAKDLAKMRMLIEKLDEIKQFDEILGTEGEASRIYFSHFGKCIRNPDFWFDGRNRRPPKDPVNACLSFGYSLLQMVLEGIILETGLDPYLGAFHKPEYGRPSLVLDLMEEFRPVVVDSLVLRLINRKQLSPAEFGPPDEDNEMVDFAVEKSGKEDNAGEIFGVENNKEINQDLTNRNDAIYLKGANRSVFISDFYGKMREKMYYPPLDYILSLREIMIQQAYKFARVIKGEESAYLPFTIR